MEGWECSRLDRWNGVKDRGPVYLTNLVLFGNCKAFEPTQLVEPSCAYLRVNIFSLSTTATGQSHPWPTCPGPSGGSPSTGYLSPTNPFNGQVLQQFMSYFRQLSLLDWSPSALPRAETWVSSPPLESTRR